MGPTPSLGTMSTVKAYQIGDSRGNPTIGIETKVGDIELFAGVPSGASTGTREALELRDGNPKDFLGKGVDRAINNVNKIILPAIAKLDPSDQRKIDDRMIKLDGTENKRNLGANAILAVSLIKAKEAAARKKIPLYRYLGQLHGENKPTLLPTPMMNVINGGAHAKNGLDFQEFMIVPVGAATFAEAMKMGMEVYGHLGKIVQASGVGDEGGFSPTSFRKPTGTERVKEACDLLIDAIKKAGYKPGKQIAIAFDPAASEFFKEGCYQMAGKQRLSPQAMVNFYSELVNLYPIVSIEDGMAEGDEVGWKLLTKAIGKKIQLVGDDVFVTNSKIFQRGINQGIANAILIKLNQIGTLSETLDVIKMAQTNNYNVVISHRSGETEDTTIADLAVGTRAGQIKTGAPARSERVAKYNRLLKIERDLGNKVEFLGGNVFHSLT